MILLVTATRGPVDATLLAGKERDSIALTSEERRWGRRRLVSRGGRELALALPTGTLLVPGEVLHVEEGWYLVVEAAAESVLEIRPRTQAEALRVAFEVGNRHFALAIEADRLLVPDDPALSQLLDRLGVPYARGRAVFTPVGASHRHG